MQKIVINEYCGAFGLSHEAVLRFAKYKNIILYYKKTERIFDYRYFVSSDLKIENEFCINEISRIDLALVRLVTEMGKGVNSKYSTLKIIEIPDNVKWEIENYYGSEWVAEVHRIWE